MHELAITQSIIDIVVRHAEQAQARRVLRINLVVGDLSSIVDDSVQFYFDYLSKDTLAEGAVLAFERRPVSLVCGECAYRWQPPTADWTCPRCKQAQARVAEGREFYVNSIEVE